MPYEVGPINISDYPIPEGPVASFGFTKGAPPGVDPQDEKSMYMTARSVERNTRQKVLNEYPQKTQKIRDDAKAKLAEIENSVLGDSELERLNAIQAAEERLLDALTVERDGKFARAQARYPADPTLYNPAQSAPGFWDKIRDAIDYKQKIYEWSWAYTDWWDAKAIEQGMNIISQDIALVRSRIQEQQAAQAAQKQAQEISQSITAQLSGITQAA